MKKLFPIVSALVLMLGFSPGPAKPRGGDKYRIFADSQWADSVLAKMTLEEKIGQLFMVAAFTTPDKYNLNEVRQLVEKHHIGGVIFFKGGPVQQVLATNMLQERSRVPLMVGIDGEWGLAMRLDSTVSFGFAMNLGAAQNDSLAYEVGAEIARQCRHTGIHINFAPVVDVNNNPLNPVIHMRSFGENKEAVARKSIMYMRGMQDNNILAVAKHFPGHGNTSVDSHYDLPVLLQNTKELDTLELYPFKKIIAAGVGGIMTAHLHVPVYDTTPNLSASLSPTVTTQLLRWKLKFNGITFSDALNMQGVRKFYEPGELELRALTAGNDVLLYSENVPRAIAYIKAAVDSGCITEQFINDRVRNILMVKNWVGLDECKYVSTKNLAADLMNTNALLLKRKIAEQSVTLVRNKDNVLPLRALHQKKIAVVSVGSLQKSPFQEYVGRYARAGYFYISKWGKEDEYKALRDTLKHYDHVIVAVHNVSNKMTSTYGLTDRSIAFINDMNRGKTAILVSFGSPYALSRFPDFNYIVNAYQEDATYQEAAAAVIFGSNVPTAKLPVRGSEQYGYNQGLTYKDGPIRLRYGIPEEAGMASDVLAKIDFLVKKAIKDTILPGCQILAVKDGMVVYDRTFGSHTYAGGQPVRNTDLYDVASITKVAATTLAFMKLYEQGLLDLDDKLGGHLTELEKSDKADITLRELLAHQSGLQPFIPFYKNTLTASGECDSNYCFIPIAGRTQRVAENLYIYSAYSDSIYRIMGRSPLSNRGSMRYSDLGFLYLQKVVERAAGTTIDQYVDKHIYAPLGLSRIGYRPRERFALNEIVPTEQDGYFRKQLLHGDVHDPAAAMLGGIAGHAGLFSNAHDLAVLMQVMLNEGVYGGMRLYSAKTIKQFTDKAHAQGRRGLGWDKPDPNPNHSPASRHASKESFGHSGFTGTLVWTDPQTNLTFVFLSNRVHPSSAENRLAKSNLRSDIHDLLYESIAAYEARRR